MRKWREWPRWAKVLWIVAWSAGVVGILVAYRNPGHVLMARTVRVYFAVWAFICGMVGFSLSFSPELQVSEQISNPRLFLRGIGIVLMTGGVLFLCLQIYLRGQPGW